MKRALTVITLAMIVSLAICLVGCGSNSTQNNSANSSTASDANGKTFTRHETNQDPYATRDTVSESEILEKVDSVLTAQFDSEKGAFHEYNADRSKYEVVTIEEDCLRQRCQENGSLFGTDSVDGKEMHDALEAKGNIDLYDEYGKYAGNATFSIQLNPWRSSISLQYGKYTLDGKTVMNNIWQ